MAFILKIEPEVLQDIQEGMEWYNKQQPGLGNTFYAEIKSFFEILKINPFFQVRYDEVRCLPLRKYPYMIHFTIDEERKIVIVRAVFNTSQNPVIWKKRK